MTTTRYTPGLTTASFDQLAALWGHYDRLAIEATSRRSTTIYQNRREAVRDEVSRRGAIVRRSPITGDVMVGRAADFQPITQP